MEGSYSKQFLTALLILLAISSCIKSSSAAAGSTSNEFIKSACSATTYPQLCFSSLSSHTSVIQKNPKLLVSTALSVTLSTTRSTSTMMLKLSKTHGLKPREVAAMQDCVEEIGDAVDELQKSIGEMNNLKGSNFELTMNDLQTWVSAAMTNEDTCMDGFDGKDINGNVKNVVRGRIVNVAHLTSNALALINSYASLRA